MKKIKLSTIAEELGVSIATVSLALRNSQLVANETRLKVKNYAREIGYRQRSPITNLKKNSSGVIGIIANNIARPYFTEILQEIVQELERSGHSFILFNHYDQPQKQRFFMELLLEIGADGIIMLPAIDTPLSDINFIKINNIPLVFISRQIEKENIPTFRGNDIYGIALATNHLISLGHRRIAMVGGTDATTAGRDRYQGYLEAMTSAGIEVKPEWRLPGPRNKRQGFEIAPQFLALKDKPTAAICWNDLTAIGLMNGIAVAGFTPGKDISITGYDNLEEAAITAPALTTVGNGQREIGRRAALSLLDIITCSGKLMEPEVVKPKLYIRQSTGKLPQIIA